MVFTITTTSKKLFSLKKILIDSAYPCTNDRFSTKLEPRELVSGAFRKQQNKVLQHQPLLHRSIHVTSVEESPNVSPQLPSFKDQRKCQMCQNPKSLKILEQHSTVPKYVPTLRDLVSFKQHRMQTAGTWIYPSVPRCGREDVSFVPNYWIRFKLHWPKINPCPISWSTLILLRN